jgi:hypothetical protein
MFTLRTKNSLPELLQFVQTTRGCDPVGVTQSVVAGRESDTSLDPPPSVYFLSLLGL